MLRLYNILWYFELYYCFTEENIHIFDFNNFVEREMNFHWVNYEHITNEFVLRNFSD